MAQVPNPRLGSTPLRLHRYFEREAKAPFSLLAALAETPEARLEQADRFFAILGANQGRAETVEALLGWVRSPMHAVFLHRYLPHLNPAIEFGVIAELAKRSPYFEGAIRQAGSPHTLLTFSFEREGSARIARWFDHREIDAATWRGMSDEAKRDALLPPGTRLRKSDTAVRARGTPTEVSAPHLDLSQVEVTHRAYELDPQRLKATMEWIAGELGDWNGFHVNVGFDLHANDPHVARLGRWWKHANDYYLLKGFTEARFPGYFTGIPTPDEAPKHFREFSVNFTKTLGLGIRGNEPEKYGSPDRDRERVVLEARDVAWSKESWEAEIDHLAQAARERVWEKHSAKTLSSAIAIPTRIETEKLFRDLGFSGNFARLLSTSPWIATPFVPYETAVFPDYRTGKTFRPNEEQKARFIRAREKYVATLKQMMARHQSNKMASGKRAVMIEEALQAWAIESQVADLYGRW